MTVLAELEGCLITKENWRQPDGETQEFPPRPNIQNIKINKMKRKNNQITSS